MDGIAAHLKQTFIAKQRSKKSQKDDIIYCQLEDNTWRQFWSVTYFSQKPKRQLMIFIFSHLFGILLTSNMFEL